MNKENLISVSHEIFEKRKESLKVRDSVVNIGNDILMKKNEHQIKILVKLLTMIRQ